LVRKVEEMEAAVRILRDGESEVVLFINTRTARNFIKFVNQYLVETAPSGNDGAYRVVTEEPMSPLQALEPGEEFVRELEYRRLEFMGHTIARARSAGSGVVTTPAIQYGRHNGAAVFQAGGFERRQVPAVGDMYRLIDRSQVSKDFNRNFLEGRVMFIKGETATVWSYVSEHDGIKGTYTKIPLSALMKIEDYMKASRR